MARKSFKENDSFPIKKIVGLTLQLSPNVFFSLDKYLLKDMGGILVFCFAIQHIEMEKFY